MKTNLFKFIAIGLFAGACLSAEAAMPVVAMSKCSKNTPATPDTSSKNNNNNGSGCPSKKASAPSCPKAQPKPAPTCPKAPSKNGCSSQKDKQAAPRKLGAAQKVIQGG